MLTNSVQIKDALEAQGPYFLRLFSRDKGVLSFLSELSLESEIPSFGSLWEEFFEEESELDFEDQLRVFKTRLTTFIFLQEVEGLGLNHCAEQYSKLADFCIERALEFCGIESGLAVIGLGKLGGLELNYGSDIDIIFVAKDELSIEVKKVEKFTKVLDELRPTGRVFRVDLRLRPEGSVGPLIQPIDTMVKYYLDWGREWERGMLIKARPAGGDLELARSFIEAISPFVYRRSLDYRAIEALKGMKSAIESEAEFSQVFGQAEQVEEKTSALSRKLKRKIGAKKTKQSVEKFTKSEGDFVLAWDIKIGRGGIREIEFFVQALQLVHGGRAPRLRVSGTVKALKRLFSMGLLSEKDSLILSDAYVFFRTLEHRVQMREGEQTHSIPATRRGFEELADSLFVSGEELETLLIEHRKEVHSRFSRLFSDAEKSAENPTVDEDNRWSALLVVGIDRLSKGRAMEILAANGFKRPRDAASQIAAIQTKRFGPFYEASTLASYCLSCCAESPDADMALNNLIRFFQSVGDRPAFFSILRQHPHATRLLIHMLAVSRTFSTQLILNPNLFTRFITLGSVELSRSKIELREDLHGRLEAIGDVDHRFGIIRRFKQEETLRIALHYIGGVSQESESFSQLSDLADLVVESVSSEVYESMRRRKRDGLVLPVIAELPFSIVALGKWGSRELSFSSDLDLMFIYADERQYRLEHGFFAKLASRIMRQLSWQGADGAMYEVDARLRPSGSQGALVVSLGALKDYHESSEIWERQALLRARSLDGFLQDKFTKLRYKIVFHSEWTEEELKRYFVSMFTKIRENHFQRGERNPKFQPGGLVASEFAIQYLQILYRVDGTTFENVIRKLSALETLDTRLGELNYEELVSDYHYLRRVEAFLKIADQAATKVMKGEALTSLSRRVGASSETDFITSYDASIGRLRALWELLFLD